MQVFNKFTVRIRGALALVFCATLLWGQAVNASSIQYLGGTLTAELKLYDLTATRVGEGVVRQYQLAHDYVLGQDFMPGIPATVTNPANPRAYLAATDLNNVAIAYWNVYNFNEKIVGNGCAPLSSAITQQVYPNEVFVVRRGGCFFDTKWTNIEAAGFAGGIVINNSFSPGVSGIAHVTEDFDSPIPFFMVSYAVGEDWLRNGSLVSVIDGDNSYSFHRLPMITMEVSWTPNAVPEPGTLLLMAIGVASLGIGRRGRVEALMKKAI